ncbi:MAG: glycosyltransferase family 2 protein [Brucella sp.]
MQPLMSIIITSYNIKEYIQDCLDSIVNQTLEEIEIIIVDDGSDDGTKEIINTYASKDERIIPILLDYNSPGGVATAANVGIKAAKGKYIGFADGDDIYDPTMFEKLYMSAQRYDSDIAMCSFMEFDTETRTRTLAHDYSWPNVRAARSIEMAYPREKFDILRLLPVPWRKIYRRSLIEDNDITFHECDHFFEDNYFHWLVTIAAKRASIVDEVLCYHRRNRIGQTMLSGGERLLGVFYQHELIMTFLTQRSDGHLYYEEAARWLVGHVSWVSQTISRQYAKQFYNAARVELSRHEVENIRYFCTGGKFDRKTVQLIVCLIGRQPDLFEKILNDQYNGSAIQKINFNFIRLGWYDFCKAVPKHIFSLLRKRFFRAKPRQNEQLNAIIRLLEDTEKRIHNIQSRLDDVERILEVGLIRIAESKSVKGQGRQ